MSKLEFPKNFWWGAAMSGPQTEGNTNKKNESIMDLWYKNYPEDFFNGVGPQTTSDFYNRHTEDINMFAEVGMNSVRTSIQWSRLIDDFENHTVDQDAVDFYNTIIDEMLAKGITPVMNLFHFDMPAYLQETYGGFESRFVVDAYARYAKTCFELFGDRVKFWATFNEPIVTVEAGYLQGIHYPKIIDGKRAVQVMYNIAIASAKAVEAFRESECSKNGGKISIILNLTPTYPASQKEEDLKAVAFADDFFNNMYLDSSVKGVFPPRLMETLSENGVLWESVEGDEPLLLKNNVDYMGVNYYQPRRIQAPKDHENKPWMPTHHYQRYIWADRRINPYRGWEIYPAAMYDIAIMMRDKYADVPWYVSESGMGVEDEGRFLENGIIQDDYRIDFYKEHLTYLHKGIEEGSNCFGFHAWAAIDCWSWNNAYKNRYGFVGVDLETQARHIKKSGRWLEDVASHNGF